jgi:hypothetical protein
MQTNVVECIPMTGPIKMPKLPANEKRLNALAWVLREQFSEIMVRTVKTLAERAPDKQRNRIMAGMDLLKPNREVMMDTPTSEKTRTGLRPKRSAVRPQGIMNIICARENKDLECTLVCVKVEERGSPTQSSHCRSQHPLP